MPTLLNDTKELRHPLALQQYNRQFTIKHYFLVDKSRFFYLYSFVRLYYGEGNGRKIIFFSMRFFSF